jgi:hypothetical protein
VRRDATLGALRFACYAGALAVVLFVAPMAHAEDTPTTEPPPTETAPPALPPSVPTGPPLIEAGVTIGGLDVGGLTQRQARERVERRFGRSLQIVISRTWKFRVRPEQLGARALIGRAVEQASRRRAGFAVPLTVAVDDAVLARFLARLGRETYRAPVDARLRLVHRAPVASGSAEGRRLKELVARQSLRLTLRKHLRTPFQLPFQVIEPAIGADDIGKVIVIRRDTRQLYLYNGAELKRVFRVATGQSSYPTPLGKYEIVTKQRNPWWYPPSGSAWAEGKEPVPPGPGNPLGTRWMGISVPYVGIHGTPDSASIGYSASHGCVRMLIPQVEWLFEHVEIGTPVYIIPA